MVWTIHMYDLIVSNFAALHSTVCAVHGNAICFKTLVFCEALSLGRDGVNP